MAQPAIQTSFASGEWAPKLRSRVDIQKYRIGAALLRNFYVDWSGGGASTRQGTQFIAQVGAPGARLIPFQPSATLSYVLEFGEHYVRFYSNGARIETSPGVAYEIGSPYAASDLLYNPATGNPGLKFVQDVTSLIICHPNYVPYILTINSPTNWTLTAINFGPTIDTPVISSLTTTLAASASSWSYAYTVTAVDASGQESPAPTPSTLLNYKSITDTTNPGTNILTWAAVTGAQSYNVYKASPIFNTTFPGTIPVGFIGNTLATSFTDATPSIAPDFSQTPPLAQNPFVAGAGVIGYTVTAAGTYTSVPTVTIGAPSAGGVQATAQVSLGVTVAAIHQHNGSNQDIQLTHNSPSPAGSLMSFANGVVIKIATATLITSGIPDSWEITSISIQNPGSITTGSTPSNPRRPTGCNAVGFIGFGNSGAGGFNLDFTWGVTQLAPLIQGAGYTSVPSVTFSAGAATATSILGPDTGGNPGVPAFFQERLVLAAKPNSVQSFDMSQPGSFFNFNYSFPVEDDDAISGTIISDDLNNIRSLTASPGGLIALTGKGAWLINGGGGISTSAPITPTTVTAIPQAFNGASDLRPIKINMDYLYVTNKGNYVRDLVYNIYANIFTGNDITTLANHLFFGFNLLDWAWAEEPFKTLWAVRDDGQLLSLGFIKEQELIGWAHHDTNGQFKSVCSVLEVDQDANTRDAVYVIVERTVNGSVVQYVERFSGRFFNYGYEDSWSVDCGLQTVPQSTLTTPLTITGNPGAIGNTVTLNDTVSAPFTVTMATNNWVVRADGGIYRITVFTSASQVTATVVRPPPFYNTYTNTAFITRDYYTIWQPVTSVSGLTQLLNTPVVGVADGTVVSGTVDGSGNLALGLSATKVTIGLAFLPQLQTLPLDLGEPTVQSKRKKVPAATMRVTDTLGLQIGTTFANVTTMKDFQIGAIPTQSNGPALVTDLFVGDGRQILDQVWQEPGQLCVQQNLPYPATILGIMPEVVVGDTPSARPTQ